MERQDGMLRTGQALAAGISKPVFYQFVQSRGLEQAAHGIYLSKDAWVDAMYLLHLRCPQAVFSHETALFFHDLTDREPLAYSVTVKTGYNPTRLKDEGVQVFTIKAELHEVGLTTAQTPFGHDVPVYDMERTICDVLRSRSHIEMQTFQDALKAYARRKDKDLRTLVRYPLNTPVIVFIQHTTEAPGIPPSEEFSYAFRSPLWRGLDNLSRLPCRKSLKSSSEIHFQVALMVKAFIFQAVALLLIYVACRTMANVLL